MLKRSVGPEMGSSLKLKDLDEDSEEGEVCIPFNRGNAPEDSDISMGDKKADEITDVQGDLDMVLEKKEKLETEFKQKFEEMFKDGKWTVFDCFQMFMANNDSSDNVFRKEGKPTQKYLSRKEEYEKDLARIYGPKKEQQRDFDEGLYKLSKVYKKLRGLGKRKQSLQRDIAA